jgi:molecular chaperone HtpG
MGFVNIPHTFEEKLRKDQRLAGTVYTTVSTFAEILQENKLVFFEEYTDHGIRHIESVIRGGERLVKEETLKYILTPTDIGYYILAVILHDLGMHLSFEGFQRLLTGDFDDVKVTHFDQLTWKEEWNNFLIEAKRFSGKQLIKLFGNDKVILEDPSNKKKDELTGVDRKLVGEFIRRHHSRLAHEIALKGMPGTEILSFARQLDTEERDLIGLIARSHGKSLRASIEYIELKNGKENLKILLDCHFPFLMVLLRLSDYLQIDSSRSSFNLVLKLKTFQSPYSALEHDIHNSIRNVENRYQDDPERIFVHSTPKNAQTHVKVISLVRDIQKEFDQSWAVLGELYGNFQEKPEIKYRRILCNLEKLTDFSKLSYIPQVFNLKANEDIIKLLIEPLYGKNAKYGIRELVQNAVDACKEREIVEGGDYQPGIQIKVWCDGEYFFQVTDNGKGMSLKEIEQYFLTAGASFRSSLDWKTIFTDEKGNSKVHKIGRFGIGVLASFLIGDELIVKTRSKDSKIGYEFTTTLLTDQIQISPSENVNVGTSITIRSTAEIIKTLLKNLDGDSYTTDVNWNEWYQLPYPKIEYNIFGNKTETQRPALPLTTDVNPHWNAISTDEYSPIMWTYDGQWTRTKLFCNGVVIPYNNISEHLDLGIFTNYPVISIFDRNGNLPLALDRKSLTASVGFSHELKEDIYKDMISMLLMLEPITRVDDAQIQLSNQSLNYPGIGENRSAPYHSYGPGNYLNFPSEEYFQKGVPYNRCFLDQLLVSKKGYILNYNYFIQRLPKAHLLLVQSDIKKKVLDIDLKDCFFLFSQVKLNTIEEYKAAIYGDTMNILTGEFDKHNCNLFIKMDKYHYLFHSTSKRVPDWLKEIAKPEKQVKDWLKLRLDHPENSIIDDSFLTKYSKDLNFIREAPLYCLNAGDKHFNSLLDRYIGGDVIIPFSLEDRKRKFPRAFEELASYMKKFSSI